MDTNTPTLNAMPKRKFRFFSWRTFGYGLVGLGGLVTLIALFYAEEDWRGKRAWENYCREATARGAELDYKKFIPAPVPDAENFAMTPFLAPLFDFNPRPLKTNQSAWRDTNGYQRAVGFASNLVFYAKGTSSTPKTVLGFGRRPDLKGIIAENLKENKIASAVLKEGSAPEQMLALLKPLQPTLDELRAASQRKYVRFNIDYDDENPADIFLPHLGIIKRLAKVLQTKAAAELQLGQVNEAFADLQLNFYLTKTLRHELFIISELVRDAMFRLSMDIVWDGLASGQWSDAQLQEIQVELRDLNFPEDADWTLKSERAFFGVRMMEYMRSNLKAKEMEGLGPFFAVPTGWLYLEQTHYNEGFDRLVLPGWTKKGNNFIREKLNRTLAKPRMKRVGANYGIIKYLLRLCCPLSKTFIA